jgi:hypothetical protein
VLDEIVRNQLGQDGRPILSVRHGNKAKLLTHRRDRRAVEPFIVSTVINEVAVPVVEYLPSERP